MPSDLTITIQLPPESQEVIKRFQDMPEEMPQAIKRGMDRALQAVRGRIFEKRLSGKGPFPPEERRLGERSGKLRESLRAEPAVIQGNTVTGSIGLWRFYGRVHEFGMLIFGKPVMRFQIAGKWIMARKVLIPQRAVVRTGVTENVELITGEIASEIDKAFEGKK